jgi:hypothetical protein
VNGTDSVVFDFGVIGSCLAEFETEGLQERLGIMDKVFDVEVEGLE